MGSKFCERISGFISTVRNFVTLPCGSVTSQVYVSARERSVVNCPTLEPVKSLVSAELNGMILSSHIPSPYSDPLCTVNIVLWFAVSHVSDSMRSTGRRGKDVPPTLRSPAKEPIEPESVPVDGL